MLYVGLDIHLKQISVCVLDEDGRRLRRWPTPEQYHFDSRGRWNLGGVRHQFEDTRDFAARAGLRDVRTQT